MGIVRCERMKQRILVVVAVLLCSLYGSAHALWDADEEDQCDVAVREIMNEDRATVVDESPSRLHAVWISQECEIRAGPEFVIRKYIFFENGTFQLMRHYYAEESCSIATHSVTARGQIKILGSSLAAPGASEARYQLDTVHISPLNRQVAHKLGHRVNVSCGPQPRWRPYMAQLIYERAPERGPMTWQAAPRFNSLHGNSGHHQHQQPQQRRSLEVSKSVDCLSPLGIDFDELRLLRVQSRPTGFRSASFGGSDKPRVELFLGGLPPDQVSKRSHRPTSLQPTSLLRTDTIHNCPICGAISRGTENSPPLLHEVVALPALIGGSWISPSCESHPGGVWLRRQLRIYAGDKLWSGRWDYFSDSRCNNFLYGITAAGSYVQRARRHRRHDVDAADDDKDLLELDVFSRAKRQVDRDHERSQKFIAEWLSKKLLKGQYHHGIDIYAEEENQQHLMPSSTEEIREPLHRGKVSSDEVDLVYGPAPVVDNNDFPRDKRNVDEVDYYRQLLQSAQPSMAESFAAMLRGNQRHEETTKKPLQSITPTGTTELDLHVAESILIAGDVNLARRCGAALHDGSPQNSRLASWPASCVPHSLDAPSTLGLRARVSVDWYGQYTLLLGARDKSLWDAPLMQCGPTSMKNPLLRSHLRRSVGLRFGILFNSATRSASSGLWAAMLVVVLAYLRW